MEVPSSNGWVSWSTCSSPGPLAALLAEGAGVLQHVLWILLQKTFSLAFGLRLPICLPARDHKQNDRLYQLFVIAENDQLSKPMNYIKRCFSPLTVPRTTQAASFSIPKLMERQHRSHNSGILLICNKGCCNSALHKCIQLVCVRKAVAGLLQWRTKLFLAYRATQYYIGEGWVRKPTWIN